MGLGNLFGNLFMITFWDYADTELPSTDTMRSKHMKDMGQKGWELVSVSANLANGSHVYFWKRLITVQTIPIMNNIDCTFRRRPCGHSIMPSPI